MKKLILLFIFLFAFTINAEQSLAEKTGVIQNNDYVQLEMKDGKKVILFKARVHRAKIIGTPVTYDKKKKKYIKGEGNSPNYYAARVKEVSSFDINKKMK